MIKKLVIFLISISFYSCSDSGLDNEMVTKSINEVWNKGAYNQEFLEVFLKTGIG